MTRARPASPDAAGRGEKQTQTTPSCRVPPDRGLRRGAVRTPSCWPRGHPGEGRSAAILLENSLVVSYQVRHPLTINNQKSHSWTRSPEKRGQTAALLTTASCWRRPASPAAPERDTWWQGPLTAERNRVPRQATTRRELQNVALSRRREPRGSGVHGSVYVRLWHWEGRLEGQTQRKGCPRPTEAQGAFGGWGDVPRAGLGGCAGSRPVQVHIAVTQDGGR